MQYSGENACLPPVWLTSLIPVWGLLWIKFVVCSCLASRVFLQVLWFSSLQAKTSKFQFIHDEDLHGKQAKAGVTSCI